MPAYSGKFQYLDDTGAVLSQGPCQFRFESESAVVTPQSETAIAFDLGDVDRAVPGEWDFQLVLYTGKQIVLKQFGPAFGKLSEEMLAAWRDRTVQCLLLEDLEEVKRYTGTVAAPGISSLAEIRLYRSNLAVLPLNGMPVQWRLADLDNVSFDDSSYSIVLEAGSERMTIGKLAKKTDEFRGNLDGVMDALRTHEAETLHARFPFLNPDQLQRLLRAMPEGRSASLGVLQEIHPKLPDALIAAAVDEPLRPYFEVLRARSAGELYTGFKFVREQEEETTEDPPQAAEKPALFFWFFFPLKDGRMAWEATTGSGRATYFFVGESVERLTRGLALVNFRREPVYLPDESLEREGRFRRYAIGCRKLPDLRALRKAYQGRAIHTTVEAWTAQLEKPAAQ